MARRPRSARVAAFLGGLLVCASLAGGACASRQASGIASPGTAQPKSSPIATIESADGRLAAAVAALKQGETADSLARIAAEYHRLGVFDSALRNLDRAIALAPDRGALFAARARAWRDAGKPDIALGDAHRAAYLDPGSADAHNTLGTVLFALGAHDDALTSFGRALAIAPEAAWALNNLCYVALIKGDEPAALARCEAAVEGDAGSLTARNNLALVHASAGRMDAARTVLLAGSNRAVGLYNLGIVHLARREYAAAAEVFGEACRTTPGFEAACVRVAEARTLGARERARRSP